MQVVPIHPTPQRFLGTVLLVSAPDHQVAGNEPHCQLWERNPTTVESEEQALPQAGQRYFLFCWWSISVAWLCKILLGPSLLIICHRQGGNTFFVWAVQKMGKLLKSADSEDENFENFWRKSENLPISWFFLISEDMAFFHGYCYSDDFELWSGQLTTGLCFCWWSFSVECCAKFNSDKTDLAKAKTVHLTKWILPADTKYIHTRNLGVPLGPNFHLTSGIMVLPQHRLTAPKNRLVPKHWDVPLT